MSSLYSTWDERVEKIVLDYAESEGILDRSRLEGVSVIIRESTDRYGITTEIDLIKKPGARPDTLYLSKSVESIVNDALLDMLVERL